MLSCFQSQNLHITVAADTQSSMWHIQLFSLLPKHTFATSCGSLHQDIFCISPSSVIFFGSSFNWKYFGKCAFVSIQGFVHGSISMSLPYLPFTDKVSEEDRSLLFLCASSNCGLVFPISLPEGQHEHISHISETPSLFFPLSCLLFMFTLGMDKHPTFNFHPSKGGLLHDVYTLYDVLSFSCTTCMSLNCFSTSSLCKEVLCNAVFFFFRSRKYESASLCSKCNGVRKVFSSGMNCK